MPVEQTVLVAQAAALCSNCQCAAQRQESCARATLHLQGPTRSCTASTAPVRAASQLYHGASQPAGQAAQVRTGKVFFFARSPEAPRTTMVRHCTTLGSQQAALCGLPAQQTWACRARGPVLGQQRRAHAARSSCRFGAAFWCPPAGHLAGPCAARVGRQCSQAQHRPGSASQRELQRARAPGCRAGPGTRSRSTPSPRASRAMSEDNRRMRSTTRACCGHSSSASCGRARAQRSRV